MRSEPARLGEISLDFAEISPWQDENFPYEHTRVASPARRDRVFFNHLCFVFQMLNNIRAFVPHNGFTSLFIVKTT